MPAIHRAAARDAQPPGALPPRPLLTTAQLSVTLVSRRKALRLTQGQVAAKLGISQNRLSELERHPEQLSTRQLLDLLATLGMELIIGTKGTFGSTPPTRPAAW